MTYPPYRYLIPSRRLQTLLLSGLVCLQVLLAVSQAAVTSAITADGTLGTTVTRSGTTYTITGGVRPGNGPNLFHSFNRFSVGTGDTALFTTVGSPGGQAGIVNILSRVTGGQRSEIDGLLAATIAGANWYLLNPSGVLFGPNAAFNVSGSFHVSTADFLRFTDGARLSAHLGQASVLTLAPPTAFGFLGNPPAPITLQGTRAAVTTDKALSLVGGDITLTGGVLQAASGRIQLASVASPGEVTFAPLEAAPDLRVEGFASLGRITLSQGMNVTASSSAGAGTVLIRGGRLLVDNAALNANTMGAGAGDPLGIDVRVAEDVVLTHGGQLIAQSIGAGRAGDVRVTAGGSIAIVGQSGAIRSGLFSIAQAGGNVGDIVVSTPALTMDASLILARTEFGSLGNAGNIEVNVGRLTLTNGAQINGATRGAGRGGTITVSATDTIAISGREGALASGLFSLTTSSGNAGRVVVSAPTLRLEDGGEIQASTLGNGQAGAITLQVGRLTVTQGGRIDSSSTGAGPGGMVTIGATDTIAISGRDREGVPSGLFASAAGLGAGGSVQVTAPHVQLRDGGTMSVLSAGAGNAGTIHIQAGERFRSQQGSVAANAALAGGGTIEIHAGQLVQLLDSEITTSIGGGGGDAGNLTITAPAVVIAGSLGIANAFAGPGGNLFIDAEVFLADSSSLLAASGTLEIAATVTALTGALAPLPQAYGQVVALLPARCAARYSGGTASSLVLGGRGALPLEPGGVLPSPLALEERLVADPAVMGDPDRQQSAARFAFLEDHERALPRLPRDQWTGRCPHEGEPQASSANSQVRVNPPRRRGR
jgi:filamentous hemagglutinin family protein